MKIRLIAAALSLACVTAASAQEASPGRDLAITAFKSLDQGGRGYLDMGQVSNFGGDVFISMDADESGAVNLDEFMVWDLGMRQFAEEPPLKPRCAWCMRSGIAMATARSRAPNTARRFCSTSSGPTPTTTPYSTRTSFWVVF